MVHSALKLRAFAEDFSSSSQSFHSSKDTLSTSKTTTSGIVVNSTPTITPPTSSCPPIPVLLEMMTPQEFATVLRTRIDRLISQWPIYMSQILHHGLPSPSSSGSPLLQNGKILDMSTIRAFVSFFYPEEHQIHHIVDVSPDTLFAHLGGLQILLSFLSSKELRIIIRNRLTSANRSASVQAMVEVMRNMSVEEEEGEEEESETSDPAWKLSWQKNLPKFNHAPTKTFVDVGIATEPAEGHTAISNVPVLRPSSSDSSRPLKRAKYVPSHPLFQDPTGDFRTATTIDSTGDGAHEYVPGTTCATIPPKMADPILRPVSTQSFKSPIPSVVLPMDEDGEADAEGDTDTDIDMDVDLAVDVDERNDDSKNLTIAQVINSYRSEEAATTTLVNHSLSKERIKSTLSSPSELTPAASTFVVPNDSNSIFLASSRINDIPKGPRAMRGLLSNESTYSLSSSSGSRTPPIPNYLSRRTSPNTISSATPTEPSISQSSVVPSLKTKQEFLSDDWGLTTVIPYTGNGTRHHPIEVSEQKQNDLQVNEGSSRRFGSITFPVKPAVPSLRKPQSFAPPVSTNLSIFTAPRGPPVVPSPSTSLPPTLKSTTPATTRYEGPDLPPYDEVMAPSSASALSRSEPDTTTISVSARSKLSRREKSTSRFSGRSSRSASRSRSRSIDEKRHRLPRKSNTRYDSQPQRNSVKLPHSQLDKRTWDASSRSSSSSTSRSRSRSESRSRVPYRSRNYSYSRPPSPSSAKDRHWSPEPNRRRERGRSRSRRRRGDENLSVSRQSNGMDHWSPGRDRR